MKVRLPAVRKPRIEMVPLIDTFFLLLAFFISSVLTMEVVRGLPVELPKAKGSAPFSRQGRWIVTIAEDGRLQMEGEPVNLEELRGRLHSHPDRSSLRIGIRADRSIPYQRLMEVLAAVREAEVAKVTLLADPEGEKKGSR